MKNSKKKSGTRRKKAPKKNIASTWKLYALTLITFLFLGVFFYRHFVSYLFDSSLNGSEIKEIHQQSIPEDVQKHLNQQKLKKEISEGIRVPILMYHYIEYVDPHDKTRASLTTPPYTLELQIKTLKEAGYTFLTAGELSNVLDGKKYLPENPIVLTFDDGYRDFYTYAFPILKKYNAKATQYVISGFLGNPNHLLRSQLEEISKDNLIEIGAHTVHHVWLKGQNEKTAFDEIYKSKTDLEKIIGKPVMSFAYPYGAFDLSAIEQTKEAGFSTAVSTIPGIMQRQEHRYFLYRLRPGGRIGEELLNWLENATFRTDNP